MCIDGNNARGEMTAPEGAGSLKRIKLRHPLWDDYDQHHLIGDDDQQDATEVAGYCKHQSVHLLPGWYPVCRLGIDSGAPELPSTRHYPVVCIWI